MTAKKSRLRRTADHVLAGVAFALHLNASITFMAASTFDSASLITITTSTLATLVAGVRAYVILSNHEKPSQRHKHDLDTSQALDGHAVRWSFLSFPLIARQAIMTVPSNSITCLPLTPGDGPPL